MYYPVLPQSLCRDSFSEGNDFTVHAQAEQFTNGPNLAPRFWWRFYGKKNEGLNMREQIEVGYQTFASDGSEEFGAVREVAPGGQPELVIYIENAGDFVVPFTAVKAVHSQKVILDCDKLERRLRQAIGHAHDAEKPGL
jgi:hypothetical protein